MNPHDSVPAHLECDNGLKRPFSQNELHGKGRADWVRSSFYEGTMNTYPCQPSKGVPERQRGRGMLVRLLAKLFINPINIPLRLLAKLFINPTNIPLRCFAFATHRCPPSKGGCWSCQSSRWRFGLQAPLTSPCARFTHSKLRVKLAPPTLRAAVLLGLMAQQPP